MWIEFIKKIFRPKYKFSHFIYYDISTYIDIVEYKHKNRIKVECEGDYLESYKYKLTLINFNNEELKFIEIENFRDSFLLINELKRLNKPTYF